MSAVVIGGWTDVREIADSFGYWLAGLADGEGCFTIAPRRRASGNVTYTPHFLIQLRDDDLPVLVGVAQATGLGRVSRRGRGPRDGKAKPIARWAVNTQADCLAIVELFERFPLRSKKARDFAVWREAVRVWTSITPGHRWRGTGDYAALGELKRRLAEVREYEEPDWSIASERALTA